MIDFLVDKFLPFRFRRWWFTRAWGKDIRADLKILSDERRLKYHIRAASLNELEALSTQVKVIRGTTCHSMSLH